MLTVGIHENVAVHENKKNSHGSLVIGFKQLMKQNPIDVLNSTDAFGQDKTDILIFPPSVNTFKGEEDSFDNILKKVAEIKDPLTHIILQYVTKDKLSWDVFKDTSVDSDNIKEKLKDQDILNKVYSNIVDQYISMMEPHVGDNGKLFRVLFIRQSKTKHYPTIRKRFLDSNPFMEDMSIPKEQSKLGFTDYEKKQGLASGDPIGGSDKPSSGDTDAVSALLNR